MLKIAKTSLHIVKAHIYEIRKDIKRSKCVPSENEKDKKMEEEIKKEKNIKYILEDI